jgi:hypothetical protein
MAKSEVNKTPEVDAYMIELKHPFKAEVQALRKVLKCVNSQITEQIKWNAPSFGYKGEYLVTFNLRETKRVHLVWHNPVIVEDRERVARGRLSEPADELFERHGGCASQAP